jgi:nitroreductase
MFTTIETLTSLRSIHGNFSEREVSMQDLETILDCAIRAANASNRQSYSIVVVEDSEAIFNCCGYRGSKALLFCVDFNRLVALAKHTGHEYNAEGPVNFITGAVDTMLVAQSAAVAAKALGIDSLFTNGIHRKGLAKVAQQFNLPPKYCFPLILLVLGYPTEEPTFLKGRVRSGVIHSGHYQSLSGAELDKLVREYDAPENHLGLSTTWAADGFGHYLDWFFEKWSGRGDPAKEKEFMDFLIQAGFLKMQ